MPATPDATRLCMPAGQQAFSLNFGAFIKDPTDTAASETHINLAEWRKSVIVERRWVPENSRGMPLCVEGMRLTMRPLDKANHDAGWRFELPDNIEIYVDTPTDKYILPYEPECTPDAHFESRIPVTFAYEWKPAFVNETSCTVVSVLGSSLSSDIGTGHPRLECSWHTAEDSRYLARQIVERAEALGVRGIMKMREAVALDPTLVVAGKLFGAGLPCLMKCEIQPWFDLTPYASIVQRADDLYTTMLKHEHTRTSKSDKSSPCLSALSVRDTEEAYRKLV